MMVRADIFETEDWVVVEAEVPGAKEGSVEILVGDRVVTIRGTVSAPNPEEFRRYYSRERHPGAFRRDIMLPYPVCGNGARASHRRGVLVLLLPKRHDASPAKVRVAWDMDS